MSDLAFVANQNSKIQSLLLNETESGNANKAPKLMTLDDYPHWKNRFEIHINGVDTNLWMRIESGYSRPLGADGTAILISRLSEEQRKDYDAEKKAYAILSQAIAKDIFHQFRQFTSSKTLWDALEQRYEGNTALKNIKAKALKKEFDCFTFIGNESLDDLISRYYHLLSELHAHEITTTMVEKVQCLADALPPKWDQFIMVLKQNNTFATLDINDLIQKLREQEVENKWKAKRGVQVQDPGLYYSTPTPTQSNAPLQTAYVSNTSNSQPSNFQGSGSAQKSTSQQANTSGSSSQNSAKLQTDNFGKVTVEVAKEHMALLSTLVSSYDGLIAGQIGNCHLTDEDYSQIDKDEMDQMDIMWALASAVRRAKDYVKRTGKEITGNKDTKYGFDISTVTCYNCGEKGHFARQCEKPKQSGNRNPFNNRQSQTKQAAQNTERNLVPITPATETGSSSGSKAMVAQNDEGLDWSFRFDSENDTSEKGCMANIQELNEDSASDSDKERSSDSSSSDDESESGSSTDEASENSTSSTSSVAVTDLVPAGSSLIIEEVVATQHDRTQTTFFAFMAETSNGTQVNSETENVHQRCSMCDESEQKVENYKKHNTDLVRDLTDCTEANRVLKENESVFKKKIESLNKQVHELEINVLNKQDAITHYLNVIDETKKKLALLQVDYDTLNQKLNSYASSAYIIEHMVNRRREKKGSGVGYNECPPPLMNVITSPTNDDPITEFQVKTPLSADPKEKDLSETKTNVCSTSNSGSEKVDGLVEEWDDEDDYLCATPGLGSKATNHPTAKRIERVNPKPENLSNKNKHRDRQTGPKPKPQRTNFVKATKSDDEMISNKPTNADFVAKQTAQKQVEPKGKLGMVKKIERKQAPSQSEGSWSGTYYHDQRQHSPTFTEWRCCFECGERGHIVAYCPYLQKPRRKADPFNGKQPRILTRRSVAPAKQQVHQTDVKKKDKMHELLVSDSSNSFTPTVNQSTVYHKQSLHKQGVWKAKSEIASVDSTKMPNVGSTQPQGQWVEFWIVDANGKPKTVKAWVPNLN